VHTGQAGPAVAAAAPCGSLLVAAHSGGYVRRAESAVITARVRNAGFPALDSDEQAIAALMEADPPDLGL
jgi:hypothetical protein